MNGSYIVSPYPLRPVSPWKLEVRAAFAGKKIRRFFQTEQEAWEEGKRITEQIQQKGTESLADSGGMTMQVAVRLWQKDVGIKSKSHNDKVKKMSEMLAKRFAGPLTLVQPMSVTRWLKGLGGSETSRASFFRYARMFFRWARGCRYIAENPLEGSRAPKSNPLRNILSPAQMRDLLKQELPDKVLALVLLGGFAGLRTEEIFAMNWENINAKTGQIHVPPDAIKDTTGFDQRIVDFTEPLVRRKKFFEGKKGKIIPGSMEALHEARRRIVLGMGWSRWPKNSLRHSFATYHLARSKNPSMTAFQMGHTSSTMLERVYAVPAAMADWKAFWKI
jgi:integrase